MTATRKLSLGYLIVRLIAITIIVTPVLSGMFAPLVDKLFYPEHEWDFGLSFIVWGWSLLCYAWFMLLMVLIPYCIFYSYFSDKSLWLKLLVFYALMVLSGVIAPELTVMEAYNVNVYPRAFVLYLLLTVTLCPLLNIPLNKMANKRQADFSE